MSTANNVGFKLNYDKLFFLTDQEVRWRKIRLLIGVTLTLLTILLVFLVSIAFPAKVANSGFHTTLRAPLASGIPEKGGYVLASDTLGGLRSNTRIVESLFRQHSIVKIIAVPGDELTYNGSTLSVNGTPTNYIAQIKSGSKLSAQYLVLCKVGKCRTDEAFLIKTTNVLGKVSWDEEKEIQERLTDPKYGKKIDKIM